MPLYVADYLADTAHLNATESGAYLHLIMHYWKTGGLPQDDKQLATIAKLSMHRWTGMRPTIAEFFSAGWRHKRVDAEIAKAEASYQRRIAYFQSLDERRLPPVEWDALRTTIFARDDYTCQYCSQRGGNLECDHVIPVSRGGTNEPTNLVTACLPCNRSKGTKLPQEWLQ
jgi:5-methylcytosine-specific restriction endonuclease McrA